MPRMMPAVAMPLAFFLFWRMPRIKPMMAGIAPTPYQQQMAMEQMPRIKEAIPILLLLLVNGVFGVE